MSSLDSKAKTTKEIEEIKTEKLTALPARKWDSQKPEEADYLRFSYQKWIPLEEAKKLETSREEIIEQLKILHDTRKEYIAELEKQNESFRKQLAEANRILDSVKDMKTKDVNWFELFGDLRSALNLDESKCPICNRTLAVAKDDGMFDGKGSTFCPICGLIKHKPINANQGL